LDLSAEVGRETFLQHQAIVNAIADGDGAAAEEAITAHLTYLRNHIKAATATAAENSEGA
jgi:DNA-binding GntR family transcriptional regulator